MKWYTASTLRLAVHGIGTIIALIIALIGIAAILIALGGTGGFTSDPPPEHPRLVSAAVAASVGVLLEVFVSWLWRKAIRLIDAAEAR